MAQGQRILHRMVTRIDEAVLLRTPADDAAQTVHAATVGTTILLITNPSGPGMDRLSERTREAVIASVLVTSKAESDLAAAANHLLARTAEAQLTPGELAILRELPVSLGN